MNNEDGHRLEIDVTVLQKCTVLNESGTSFLYLKIARPIQADF
jgi:hypothetical protein